MIEIRSPTEVYGRTTAVAHLSVPVRPGVVTGFLGTNGAGRSTRMRAIVGLDRNAALRAATSMPHDDLKPEGVPVHAAASRSSAPSRPARRSPRSDRRHVPGVAHGADDP